MKKLLLLGAALLGLCAVSPIVHADDSPDYKDDRPVERPAPRYYEGRVEGPRFYLPPPPPVFIAPVPRVAFYGGYPRYYHRRHYRPYGYGYGYGYAPSVHIGFGF